jgi:hypothetical protein
MTAPIEPFLTLLFFSKQTPNMASMSLSESKTQTAQMQLSHLAFALVHLGVGHNRRDRSIADWKWRTKRKKGTWKG